VTAASPQSRCRQLAEDTEVPACGSLTEPTRYGLGVRAWEMLVTQCGHEGDCFGLRKSVRGRTRVRPPGMNNQAARILDMKRSSSSRSRVLSAVSVRAESNTFSEAEPVSVAPRLTRMMLAEASCVPSATF
jgi:hypothetical protein